MSESIIVVTEEERGLILEALDARIQELAEVVENINGDYDTEDVEEAQKDIALLDELAERLV